MRQRPARPSVGKRRDSLRPHQRQSLLTGDTRGSFLSAVEEEDFSARSKSKRTGGIMGSVRGTMSSWHTAPGGEWRALRSVLTWLLWTCLTRASRPGTYVGGGVRKRGRGVGWEPGGPAGWWWAPVAPETSAGGVSSGCPGGGALTWWGALLRVVAAGQ